MLIDAHDEFSPAPGYLDTASLGRPPARSVAALERAVRLAAEGRPDQAAAFRAVEEARASFAALVGLGPERVAVGSSVSAHVGLVAAALPEGGEVLCARGEFSSLVTPFALRAGVRLREAALAGLAEAVGPGTVLVAVSSVQSSDGSRADLAAVTEAARAHGALTLVDTTQSTGWLPLSADAFDFTVCGAFKWLLCPRGTSFLTVPADGGGLAPLAAGWAAAADPAGSVYGPVTELATGGRRFDTSPALHTYVAAAPALALVRELGPETIGAHDLRLADRFRAGLAELGLPPGPGGSPIVSVPESGEALAALDAAGVRVTRRGGRLRFAFHLYNGDADVDAALNAFLRSA
ncbi:aminotransferase class V-fold PLP-dependent enzyme [Streptomyces sp. 3MP-14]|uniref:Aminotransferase class V-fold PLP-dependent enzyme n=1 Tax=Streptomyces mimosae TaxID=2586635 RepID=A0A5N6AE51_9ACTN|nr:MULTISPECIES: aminotransferase class V-fold PLP-dependent enzyme [Streptomyces]KAB8166462.1 aminotransferase class V-fold PLP-dependent enzyme [Streptomyces mimosae]KAB8178891.1 aminotransferase class V-fold PLP-dependent enzyme [Streptomyces sp. 3MP-14]